MKSCKVVVEQAYLGESLLFYLLVLQYMYQRTIVGQTIGELGLIFKHANVLSQVGNIPRAQYALYKKKMSLKESKNIHTMALMVFMYCQ